MAEGKRGNRARETIIANCGEGSMGKSAAVKMVYERLKKVADIEPEELEKKEKEVFAWMEINEIKVGISSFGDTRQTVKEHLDELKEKGCQIIVTACRNNHEMIKLLKSYAPTYRIIRTSNARLYEEATNPRVAPKGILDRFNENWAEEIANLIESWCYV